MLLNVDVVSSVSRTSSTFFRKQGLNCASGNQTQTVLTVQKNQVSERNSHGKTNVTLTAFMGLGMMFVVNTCKEL